MLLISVSRECTQYCKRCMREMLHRQDRGSGTVLAVGIVIMVISILMTASCVGYVLIEKHHAHAVATVAALAGASALQSSGNTENECAIVGQAVHVNGGLLESCVVEHHDVTVRVSMPLSLIGVSKVSVAARAGLENCSPSDADNLK